MKHFRIILAATRITVAVLFAANVFFFMVQLYNSIKARYIDDVEQSLCRAEQIEIVERISKSGFPIPPIWWLWRFSQEVGCGRCLYRRRACSGRLFASGTGAPDKQILSEITKYLHHTYDAGLGEPDIAELESAFRRDLNFSGLLSRDSARGRPDGAAEFTADCGDSLPG